MYHEKKNAARVRINPFHAGNRQRKPNVKDVASKSNNFHK
jgi:hypothetical protein